MRLSFRQLGQRFNRNWIFRKLDFECGPNEIVAVLGANGSGKSTLLHIVAGLLRPSEGEIAYEFQNQTIPRESIFRYLMWVGPYVGVSDELRLGELLDFHQTCKAWRGGMDRRSVLRSVRLEKEEAKTIGDFSSGMKQRLQLAIAFYTEAPLVLLDEPTANLDRQNVAWYQQTLEEESSGRLVIIASNQPEEYQQATRRLSL
jgi:ABC-type multidrug transport system ATPase subunit